MCRKTGVGYEFLGFGIFVRGLLSWGCLECRVVGVSNGDKGV